MAYEPLLDRAEALCSMLEGEARGQGERVVEVCRQLSQRPREDGKLSATTEEVPLRVELGRLVEVLSRRGAKAIALATLGRAALADLAGDRNAFVQACGDCDRNLSMTGL